MTEVICGRCGKICEKDLSCYNKWYGFLCEKCFNEIGKEWL
ncbi:MAG: hypothetical protein QW609_04285 [Candidatus Aenigmatarchaeota archaeon]